MSIDPILPLSISIAEGERTYALFLGSGISKNAGIPTGRDIFRETIELLYQMENDVKETDEEKVSKWFEESEFKDWGYSEILEKLLPSREDRRNFLEKFFLGKNPTAAHDSIAEMVEKNLVKCIITTNFDRLTEQALDKKGIAYDVVTSLKDLSDLKPREHSNCRILKLHGDYQKSNIKNTKEEVENLEKELENEFNEILDNFGIIVIGYGGSDNGVMKCLEERNNPRYTLYWVTRENVNERVKELIRQQNGKEIVRSSSDKFLEELLRKIDIYKTYDSGETPEFFIQEVIGYLKKDDYIGFNEALKRQKKVIEKKYFEVTRKTDELFKSHEDFESYSEIIITSLGEEPKVNGSLDIPIVGFIEFEKSINVLTAIGLVLIEYGTTRYFKNVLQVLNDIYDIQPMIGIDLRVSNISKAAVHNLFYQWGAYALKKENFTALKELLNYKIIENDLSYPEIESKEIWLLLGGRNLATFDRNSVKIFTLLLNSYEEKEFLNEFFRSHEDFSICLYQFNLILCLFSIKRIDKSVYPHSSRLDGRDIRLFIEPLLFKIKTDHDFNFALSELFDDLEHTDEGIRTEFIQNFPKRCKIINEYIRKRFEFDNINCEYFNE